VGDRCGVCHREPCRCCVEYIDTDMASYIDSLERDAAHAVVAALHASNAEHIRIAQEQRTRAEQAEAERDAACAEVAALKQENGLLRMRVESDLMGNARAYARAERAEAECQRLALLMEDDAKDYGQLEAELTAARAERDIEAREHLFWTKEAEAMRAALAAALAAKP
jgi:hypothetical protein